MTTPRDPDPGPAGSPFGNGYGTSNPDSTFSNEYASISDGGASGYGAGPAYPQQNGLAMAALIVGIVSLLAMLFPPLAALAALAAIILGVLGLRKARTMQPGSERHGMSIAGIVLGAIALLLSLALMAFFGFVMTNFLNSGVIEQCEHLQNAPEALEACVTDFVENNPNSPFNAE